MRIGGCRCWRPDFWSRAPWRSGRRSPVAQTDENTAGATGELPQSRGTGRSASRPSLPPEPPHGRAGRQGGEDAAPGASCPDRGNNLELII